jgi:serine acetyltransferase
MIQLSITLRLLCRSVNISGNVVIHEKKYTWVQVLKLSTIRNRTGDNHGAGAVVSKVCLNFCTAVGIPGKPIKFHNINNLKTRMSTIL